MYKIQKGVPIPTIKRNMKRRKYPLDEMVVGDFIFVPDKAIKDIASHISATAKQLGSKFQARTITGVQVGDEWRPCEPDTPGATHGVGVWRIE